jgi:hypothetical protein
VTFVSVFVMIGGAGLVLGLGLGLFLPSWRVVASVIAAAAFAAWLGFRYLSRTCGGDGDDDPIVLVYVMMATNLGGFIVGLAIGRGSRRASASPPG